MQIIQQILFVIVAGIAIWLFTRKIKEIRRNILLGQDAPYYDRPAERWKNVFLLAFGQKKMFRNPLVALLHFVIYVGFIIINIEVLEIFLDGILGTHRLFAESFGPLYRGLINGFEFLAVGVIFVCVIFLARRNIIKLKRFISHDLDGWPRSDANYILISEIILMTLFLTMNAADTLLQQSNQIHYSNYQTGNFYFSQFLHPLFNNFSDSSLITIERTAWWLHILGIFAFLNYLPYSKHLHILLAFPNAYYTRLEPKGKMKNMKNIQREVELMLNPPVETHNSESPQDNASIQKFGAKDIFDLTWRNLLDAYSCTECGRCSAACPATQTGKKLSPRKIVMDTRDRTEEIAKNINANGQFKDDGKTLLHNYISVEELRACTTCNACVEECPVSISPLEIILELRRALIMEESNAPPEWNAMSSNIENNFAPWKFSPDERDKWTQEIQ